MPFTLFRCTVISCSIASGSSGGVNGGVSGGVSGGGVGFSDYVIRAYLNCAGPRT
jgi:hypothetical protein